MKKQTILSLIMIITLLLVTSYTSAQSNQPLYDCKLVDDTVDINALSSKIPYTQWYSIENVRTALRNLRSFCCNKGILSKTTKACQDTKNNTMYAHSPYLYDHLIDIGWRALDGDMNLQYPGAKINPNGENRRKFMNEAGQLGNGAQPRVILENFKNQRFGESNENNLQECNTFQGVQENISLSEHYQAVCNISQCIQQSILQGNGGIPNLAPGRKVSSEIPGFEACHILAQQRINQEVQLVKAQMMELSSRMLKTVSNSYMSEYLVQGRMVTLLEKMSQMEAAFSTITTKVPEGTRMCNK